MPVFYYDPPDRFIAGSVGQPGDRTFYLQATSVGRVTSVVLEKFQVSLLAERIDELLDEVLRRTGDAAEIPESAPAALRDDGPLDLPLTEDFRVGAIALAWDSDGDRVVIEAQEESDAPVEPLSDDIPVDGPGVLRVRITPARPARSRSARSSWSRPAARRARCAGCRSTRAVTCARGRTATGPPVPDNAVPTTPVPDNTGGRGTPACPRGNARRLELLERGALTVEGAWSTPPTRPCSARLSPMAPRRTACTSRSRGSGRSGTSRTARWRAARSPPTSSPGRQAGTSCRPRSSATARSGRACASSGSTSTRAST